MIRHVSDRFSQRCFSSEDIKWCVLHGIQLHDSIIKKNGSCYHERTNQGILYVEQKGDFDQYIAKSLELEFIIYHRLLNNLVIRNRKKNWFHSSADCFSICISSSAQENLVSNLILRASLKLFVSVNGLCFKTFILNFQHSYVHQKFNNCSEYQG